MAWWDFRHRVSARETSPRPRSRRSMIGDVFPRLEATTPRIRKQIETGREGEREKALLSPVFEEQQHFQQGPQHYHNQQQHSHQHHYQHHQHQHEQSQPQSQIPTTEPALTVHIDIRFTDPTFPRSRYARTYDSSSTLRATPRLCRGLVRRIERCAEEFITRKDSGALDMFDRKRSSSRSSNSRSSSRGAGGGDARRERDEEYGYERKPQRFEMTFRVMRRSGKGKWADTERTYRSYQKQTLTTAQTKEVALAVHRMVGLFLRRHDEGFRWVDCPAPDDDADIMGPGTEVGTGKGASEGGRPRSLRDGSLSVSAVPGTRFVEATQSYEFVPGYTVDLDFRRMNTSPSSQSQGWSSSSLSLSSPSSSRRIQIASAQTTPLTVAMAEDLLWNGLQFVNQRLDSKKRELDDRSWDQQHSRAVSTLDSGPDTLELSLRVSNNLGPTFTHTHRTIHSKLPLFSNTHNSGDDDHNNNHECEHFLTTLQAHLSHLRNETDATLNTLNDFEFRVVELQGVDWTLHNPPTLTFTLGPAASYGRRTIHAALDRLQTGVGDVLRGHNLAIHIRATKRGHVVLDKAIVAHEKKRGVKYSAGVEGGFGLLSSTSSSSSPSSRSREDAQRAFVARLRERIQADLDRVFEDSCNIDDLPDEEDDQGEEDHHNCTTDRPVTPHQPDQVNFVGGSPASPSPLGRPRTPRVFLLSGQSIESLGSVDYLRATAAAALASASAPPSPASGSKDSSRPGSLFGNRRLSPSPSPSPLSRATTPTPTKDSQGLGLELGLGLGLGMETASRAGAGTPGLRAAPEIKPQRSFSLVSRQKSSGLLSARSASMLSSRARVSEASTLIEKNQEEGLNVAATSDDNRDGKGAGAAGSMTSGEEARVRSGELPVAHQSSTSDPAMKPKGIVKTDDIAGETPPSTSASTSINTPTKNPRRMDTPGPYVDAREYFAPSPSPARTPRSEDVLKADLASTLANADGSNPRRAAMSPREDDEFSTAPSTPELSTSGSSPRHSVLITPRFTFARRTPSGDIDGEKGDDTGELDNVEGDDNQHELQGLSYPDSEGDFGYGHHDQGQDHDDYDLDSGLRSSSNQPTPFAEKGLKDVEAPGPESMPEADPERTLPNPSPDETESDANKLPLQPPEDTDPAARAVLLCSRSCTPPESTTNTPQTTANLVTTTPGINDNNTILTPSKIPLPPSSPSTPIGTELEPTESERPENPTPDSPTRKSVGSETQDNSTSDPTSCVSEPQEKQDQAEESWDGSKKVDATLPTLAAENEGQGENLTKGQAEEPEADRTTIALGGEDSDDGADVQTEETSETSSATEEESEKEVVSLEDTIGVDVGPAVEVDLLSHTPEDKTEDQTGEETGPVSDSQCPDDTPNEEDGVLPGTEFPLLPLPPLANNFSDESPSPTAREISPPAANIEAENGPSGPLASPPAQDEKTDAAKSAVSEPEDQSEEDPAAPSEREVGAGDDSDAASGSLDVDADSGDVHSSAKAVAAPGAVPQLPPVVETEADTEAGSEADAEADVKADDTDADEPCQRSLGLIEQDEGEAIMDPADSTDMENPAGRKTKDDADVEINPVVPTRGSSPDQTVGELQPVLAAALPAALPVHSVQPDASGPDPAIRDASKGSGALAHGDSVASEEKVEPHAGPDTETTPSGSDARNAESGDDDGVEVANGGDRGTQDGDLACPDGVEDENADSEAGIVKAESTVEKKDANPRGYEIAQPEPSPLDELAHGIGGGEVAFESDQAAAVGEDGWNDAQKSINFGPEPAVDAVSTLKVEPGPQSLGGNEAAPPASGLSTPSPETETEPEADPEPKGSDLGFARDHIPQPESQPESPSTSPAPCKSVDQGTTTQLQPSPSNPDHHHHHHLISTTDSPITLKPSLLIPSSPLTTLGLRTPHQLLTNTLHPNLRAALGGIKPSACSTPRRGVSPPVSQQRRRGGFWMGSDVDADGEGLRGGRAGAGLWSSSSSSSSTSGSELDSESGSGSTDCESSVEVEIGIGKEGPQVVSEESGVSTGIGIDTRTSTGTENHSKGADSGADNDPSVLPKMVMLLAGVVVVGKMMKNATA